MYALCRSLCGLDGNEERIPLGYRRMVCRCLSARSLWYCNRSAGRTAQCCRTCRSHRRRGGNHRYCQYVLLLAARCILALGEAGNFPAAIKVTAEYFPKKDRAYATSIFNAGASIGALIAPLTIPILAKAFGWEMAFIVIGGLGFIWMGFWVFMYDAPSKSKHVNKAELEYIEQDQNEAGAGPKTEEKDEKKMRFWQCFSYKQTWAFVFGKFTTDGVWWFFLFWTPSYLNSQFGIKTSDPLGMGLIFTLYAITMLSIYGGKLPTIFINKTGMNPYAARMKAMLIFAFFPLVVLLAQPLGTFSPWFPVILIGIGGAAHQSWSANIFSTVGDMFPEQQLQVSPVSVVWPVVSVQ